MKFLHYLVIGVIFNILALSTISCKEKVDHEITCNYWYINECNQQLKMDVYNNTNTHLNTYQLNSGDHLLVKLKGMGGAGPFQYDTFVDKQGFEIIVTFTDGKKITYKNGEGLLYEGAYEKTKISATEYMLKFIFTEDVYNKAK